MGGTGNESHDKMEYCGETNDVVKEDGRTWGEQTRGKCWLDRLAATDRM